MTAESTEGDLEKKWQAAVRSILAEIPADYGRAKALVASLRRALDSEAAIAISESFNREVQKRPRQSMEEKRALVRWVNSELKGIGLCLRNPDGQAAILVADYRDDDKTESRLRLQTANTAGSPKRLSLPSELPSLQLRVRPSAMDEVKPTQSPPRRSR